MVRLCNTRRGPCYSCSCQALVGASGARHRPGHPRLRGASRRPPQSPAASSHPRSGARADTAANSGSRRRTPSGRPRHRQISIQRRDAALTRSLADLRATPVGGLTCPRGRDSLPGRPAFFRPIIARIQPCIMFFFRLIISFLQDLFLAFYFSPRKVRNNLFLPKQILPHEAKQIDRKSVV